MTRYLRPVQHEDSNGKCIVDYYVFESSSDLPTLDEALRLVAEPLDLDDSGNEENEREE